MEALAKCVKLTAPVAVLETVRNRWRGLDYPASSEIRRFQRHDAVPDLADGGPGYSEALRRDAAAPHRAADSAHVLRRQLRGVGGSGLIGGCNTNSAAPLGGYANRSSSSTGEAGFVHTSSVGAVFTLNIFFQFAVK